MKITRRGFFSRGVMFGSTVFIPKSLIRRFEMGKDFSQNLNNTLKVKKKEVSSDMSRYHKSIYVGRESAYLWNENSVSYDHGKTWKKNSMVPDYKENLPYGYRRNIRTSVFDPNTGRLITTVNALDVPDLDPAIHEPPIALNTYYLRYRVAKEGQNKWLFDERIIQEGDFSPENPFPQVYVGKNSIFNGDNGSIPIVTKKGKILIPSQITPLDSKGELFNPYKVTSYHDTVILMGTWTENNRIRWRMSEKIKGNPDKSTRGMVEPTLLELEDGRLFMVMRGSNAGALHLPSYKWFSVSEDEGRTWTEPAPFTLDDGKTFFSPSSMSTLFRHSSGRCFWVGNMSDDNCEGNSPRWPLVIGEINTKSLKLIKKSLLVVDTQHKEDMEKGRLDISHFALLEDRQTKDIILTYPRSYDSYKSREWILNRIWVSK